MASWSLANADRPAAAGWRAPLLVALAVCAAGAAILAPPFAMPAWYYHFADRRTLLGVPNALNVLSNAPWLPIGVVGLLFIWNHRAGTTESPFANEHERVAFAALFGSIAGLALGSAWFHLAPSPATLLWDRLPMSVAFMALFSIVIGEHVGRRFGAALFWPLVAIGVGSVLHWHHSAALGRPDERLYALVQFFPMLAIPLVVLLYRAPGTRPGDLFAALGCYAVAKLFELADHPVLAATGGAISGHTLKHLAAVGATLWLLRLLTRRRPVGRRAYRGLP